MTHLLDTNSFIDHLRHGPASKVTAKLAAAPPDDVFLCSVVLAELIYGAAQWPSPPRGELGIDRQAEATIRIVAVRRPSGRRVWKDSGAFGQRGDSNRTQRFDDSRYCPGQSDDAGDSQHHGIQPGAWPGHRGLAVSGLPAGPAGGSAVPWTALPPPAVFSSYLFAARVRAAFTAASWRSFGPLVRTAFSAAACRSLAVRAWAAACRLPRQRGVRRGRLPFPLQRPLNRLGPLGRGLALGRCPVPTCIGPGRALARPFRGLALFGRRQIDARPPSLGQPDGDGLLGRSRPVLAFADVLDLLADELAGLRRGRLALPFILAGPFNRFLFRHGIPLSVSYSGPQTNLGQTPCQKNLQTRLRGLSRVAGNRPAVHGG